MKGLIKLDTQRKQIPIKKGWLHLRESTSDEFYLIGSKCTQCGFVHFPKMRACPLCKKKNLMIEVPLSRKGVIDSFTVARQGTPGFAAPYIQAYVLLPEKVKIFTLIESSEIADDSLTIGQEVELVFVKICEDEHGNEIIGWKFRLMAQS